MKIKKELITREIAGDTVLVPVGKSVYDANGLFILPLLAGGSQFLMTQLQNGKMTEEQKAAQQNNPANSGFMKWFFPIFSVWICSTSNAAFSIYWMAANVIMIIQNWALNLYFDREDAKLALQAKKNDD